MKNLASLSSGRVRTVSQELDRAAVLLQKLVRLKAADDAGYCSCVTCGVRGHWKEMQGGHFISRTFKRWKCDERNVHPQCKGCNGFGMKYGNAEAEYMSYMMGRYGLETVQHMLSTRRDITKYSRDEVEEMQAEFKREIKKELERVG